MFLHQEESLDRAGIKALQWQRLQDTLRHCLQSDFYRQRFQEANLSLDDITCFS